MNKLPAPFLGKFYCVYLDDIVIFSKNAEEHEDHMCKFFTILQEHNLKLKLSKCHLELPEIKLLAYVINKDGKNLIPIKSKL